MNCKLIYPTLGTFSSQLGDGLVWIEYSLSGDRKVQCTVDGDTNYVTCVLSQRNNTLPRTQRGLRVWAYIQLYTPPLDQRFS